MKYTSFNTRFVINTHGIVKDEIKLIFYSLAGLFSLAYIAVSLIR